MFGYSDFESIVLNKMIERERLDREKREGKSEPSLET